MDSVTESRMAIALAREGGIGIIHRFMTIQEQVEQVLKVKRSESVVIEQPYTISPDSKIREANNIMTVNGISGLLVKDLDNKLCGGIINILSRKLERMSIENQRKLKNCVLEMILNTPAPRDLLTLIPKDLMK